MMRNEAAPLAVWPSGRKVLVLAIESLVKRPEGDAT
jgi:hypothetical protein